MMLVDRDKAIEACAKACEDKAEEWSVQESARRWQRECAAAIRQLTLEECRVEVGDCDSLIGMLRKEASRCWDSELTLYSSAAKAIESISAQVAELRKDAERYRRLRDAHGQLHVYRGTEEHSLLPTELDSAIDSLKESGK